MEFFAAGGIHTKPERFIWRLRLRIGIILFIWTVLVIRGHADDCCVIGIDERSRGGVADVGGGFRERIQHGRRTTRPKSRFRLFTPTLKR